MARTDWGHGNEPLSSWSCKGCTNICYLSLPNGEVGTYCRTVIEKGEYRRKWFGNECRCLDYTTDPRKTDRRVQVHPSFLKGG